VSARSIARLAAAYLVFAAVVLAPAWATGRLVGHPDVDVWNHAWGFWWVAESLADGHLPWRTNLLAAPTGGTLYFVDLPGALVALPVTLLFGTTAAWNLVMLGRVAAAGLFAHLLAERVSKPGPHAFVAGVAYATTPFLWCELANGISEVAATWWIPALLWAGDRARSGSNRDALFLGVLGGASAWANFYYCAVAAVLLGVDWATRPSRALLRPALVAGGVAAALGLPAFAAIRASVTAADAVVRRSTDLNAALAAHNAVDPRVYFMPGAFQSVDLAAVYGEPFVHTGYLRWTVILLAVAGAWALGKVSRRWILLGALSLVLGLGPYLWWGSGFVEVGGNVLSLPFAWLQRLIPDLAITHPLRLSIGAQAIACALAAVALVERPRAWIAVAGAAVALETALASAARWPAPTAPAEIPSVYAEIAASDDPRAVLDLPAEVGTTMATSQIFWFQTAHRRPVPYTPDVRAGSTRDEYTFRQIFPHPQGRPGERGRFVLPRLNAAAVSHLAQRYGWLVVHRDWEERVGQPGVFAEAILPVLGAPREDGPLLVWRLPLAGR
jgi:hypothetical protein